MAKIDIQDVSNKNDIKLFSSLPNRFYKHEKGYIPQLLKHEADFCSPDKNPFLKNNIHAFWIAWHKGLPIGRISAHLDKTYASKHSHETGFFGCLDSVDDHDVVSALIEKAEKWLKMRGIKTVKGPYQFNINQVCGLQINGHDSPPVVKTGFSPPWMSDYVEDNGYTKAKDLVCYTHNTEHSKDWLDRFERITAKSPQLSTDLSIQPIKAKDYPKYLDDMRRLYNQGYAFNWESTPVSYEESNFLYGFMKPVLFDDWMIMAWQGDKPVGMLSLIPNVDEKIRDLNGKLGIFNTLKLGYRLYTGSFHTTRIPIICIHPSLRNTAAGAYISSGMMAQCLKTALKNNVKAIEISWMLEDNAAILNLVKKLPSEYTRTYRIYEKNL